jgi:STE24 endopeptidase
MLAAMLIDPYTLPPDKLSQAIQLSHLYDITDFGGPVWMVLAVLVALRLHWFARLRDWTQRITPRWWLQGIILAPIFVLLFTLIGLPIDILIHYGKLMYGLSIQPWPGWFADQAKGMLPNLILAIPMLLLGFFLIRRSPKRWWLWFWLLMLPVMVFSTYINPIIVAPMYSNFEPLAKSNPDLVGKMETVIAKTNLSIPPSHILMMKAGSKSTVLNAYVTGLGSSRRVVLYDTLIANAPTDEVLFIFAHELGHSAFNHILKRTAFQAVLMLVELFVARLCALWLIRRFGTRWHISALGDWAAIGVLALVFIVVNFLSQPVQNAFSRLQEHHADIYGLEAVHGIVADPQSAAADFEQRSGENTLDPPHENPLIVIWSYTHPATTERKQFEATYNPWRAGQHPKYFPDDKAQ